MVPAAGLAIGMVLSHTGCGDGVATGAGAGVGQVVFDICFDLFVLAGFLKGDRVLVFVMFEPGDDSELISQMYLLDQLRYR